MATVDMVRAVLLVGGTAGALVGAWLPVPEWARSTDRAVPRIATAVLVLAVLGAVLLWRRSRLDADRSRAAPAGWVAAFAAIVAAVWAAQHLATDLTEGYVDASGPVVAGGAGVALLGLLMAVPALRRRPGPRTGQVLAPARSARRARVDGPSQWAWP